MTLLNSHTTNSSWLLVMAKISLHALSSSSFNVFFKKKYRLAVILRFCAEAEASRSSWVFRKNLSRRVFSVWEPFHAKDKHIRKFRKASTVEALEVLCAFSSPVQQVGHSQGSGPIKEPAACQPGHRLQSVSTSRTSEVTWISQPKPKNSRFSTKRHAFHHAHTTGSTTHRSHDLKIRNNEIPTRKNFHWRRGTRKTSYESGYNAAYNL